ncbi:MAG: hypothetical protein ACRDRL_10430 [Sciscionella sp.]
MAELVTSVAAGVAVIAAVLAVWQLWRAQRRAGEVAQRIEQARDVALAVERHAEQAARDAQDARSQARWAWEQVKLASEQLEHARSENRDGALAEQWEWGYALISSSRDVVDNSRELIRIALDKQVTPHYRLAAERQYWHAGQRWQDTMVKALARTTPALELQQQVQTFAQIERRLHGQLGVLLRGAETGTLSDGDMLSGQVVGVGHELEHARRQLQRTLSASLATRDSSTSPRISPDRGSIPAAPSAIGIQLPAENHSARPRSSEPDSETQSGSNTRQ